MQYGRKSIHAVSVAVCFAMLIPMDVLAAQASATLKIADVALQDGGVFVVQVFTAEGTPHAGIPVTIQQQGQPLVKTVTDTNGMLAVRGLQGGVYQVVSGKTVGSYRLWAPDTAPPAASAGALLVEGQGVVRGQMGGGGLLANPWVLTAVIATAITVPIAVANSSSGS